MGRVDAAIESLRVNVDDKIGKCLLANRHILLQKTGAEVDHEGGGSNKYKLYGTKDQLKRATEALKRVTTHCAWGANDTKVAKLLDPPAIDTVQLRLSPMTNLLKDFSRTLSAGAVQVKIGKDPSCDITVNDPMMSRIHCAIELDIERRGVYVIDASTNGTFLNGKPLPRKQSGKVMLSHGDELNLREAEGEFGYIVNLK